MSLSSDLLSQFAKVTKDTTKKKSEITVYGTVKEQDGKFYVQIDGSNILTPTSTTADMKHGERVMVQIKDHSAIIIGNISSPAARTEDVKNIKLDVDKYEVKTNKTSTINSESTNDQYASAKAVYDSTDFLTNTELESLLSDD